MSSATIPPQFEIVDRPLDTQMTISMGPQHPSTHGVLRLELVLDGEMVVKATPDIGYLHTGMEKLFEYKKYQQGIVITDRMDYLNPLGNNLAYVMAGEKLLGLEIPERAQVIRVLMCELQRIASHLVWLGTHALDIGAMTVFFYCFPRARKDPEPDRSSVRWTTDAVDTSHRRFDDGSAGGFRESLQTVSRLLPSRARRVSQTAQPATRFFSDARRASDASRGRRDRLGTVGPCLRGSGRESRYTSRESVQQVMRTTI
jgi:NADH-quinone oxidoreductase subunit D